MPTEKQPGGDLTMGDRQWLQDQNQKVNALMDWIEEQQALAALFPVDPFLVELDEQMPSKED